MCYFFSVQNTHGEVARNWVVLIPSYLIKVSQPSAGFFLRESMNGWMANPRTALGDDFAAANKALNHHDQLVSECYLQKKWMRHYWLWWNRISSIRIHLKWVVSFHWGEGLISPGFVDSVKAPGFIYSLHVIRYDGSHRWVRVRVGYFGHIKVVEETESSEKATVSHHECTINLEHTLS